MHVLKINKKLRKLYQKSVELFQLVNKENPALRNRRTATESDDCKLSQSLLLKLKEKERWLGMVCIRRKTETVQASFFFFFFSFTVQRKNGGQLGLQEQTTLRAHLVSLATAVQKCLEIWNEGFQFLEIYLRTTCFVCRGS